MKKRQRESQPKNSTESGQLYVLATRRRDNCSSESYVLHAEPKAESKFLYRGNVWIDAEEIEAEPAKNPSFWIKDTKVHHAYAKTAHFWLPASSRSETVLRFGGTAL